MNVEYSAPSVTIYTFCTGSSIISTHPFPVFLIAFDHLHIDINHDKKKSYKKGPQLNWKMELSISIISMCPSD